MEYYKEFLEALSEHTDPAIFVFHHGVNGLLREFEAWLQGEGLLAKEEIPPEAFKRSSPIK